MSMTGTATLHSLCQYISGFSYCLLPVLRMLQTLEDQGLGEGKHKHEGLYKIHETTESI